MGVKTQSLCSVLAEGCICSGKEKTAVLRQLNQTGVVGGLCPEGTPSLRVHKCTAGASSSLAVCVPLFQQGSGGKTCKKALVKPQKKHATADMAGSRGCHWVALEKDLPRWLSELPASSWTHHPET